MGWPAVERAGKLWVDAQARGGKGMQCMGRCTGGGKTCNAGLFRMLGWGPALEATWVAEGAPDRLAPPPQHAPNGPLQS